MSLLEELINRRRVTQPRAPMDERLPDGRSVAELMMSIPQLAQPVSRPRVVGEGAPLGAPPPVPTFNPTGVPRPGGPVPANQQPDVRVGSQVQPGAGNLERLMAERQALATADPSSQVRRTGWGYEQQPPEQSPSRLKQALIGGLQGAAMAGRGGNVWETLGGAATGAAAGGISPQLMQAFTRRQELDRNAADMAGEQALQLRHAQIGETVAQAEQRRVQPILELEKLRRAEEQADELEAGRNRRADQANRTRSQTAAETNRMRQERLAEQTRHNKAVEGKTAATEEITVAGRKFKVSPSTAARILESRSTAANKPDKERVESQLEADLETEAANDHLTKRREAEESASALRKERDDLSASPVAARRSEARIKELDRQIAQAEQEARYRQTEADNSFARARKAKAKGGAGSSTAKPTSGRTIEGAVEAFRKKVGREPTDEEVERMRRAL